MESPMVSPNSPERTASFRTSEVRGRPKFHSIHSGPGTPSGIGKERFDDDGNARLGTGESPESRGSPGTPGSVVQQLAVWDKELEEIERQEGELMQGQWKLLREQMNTLMQGLAEIRGQHAELRRNFRITGTDLQRVQSDVRDTENRVASALEKERDMRLDWWPELDKVLDPIRQELREVASRQVPGHRPSMTMSSPDRGGGIDSPEASAFAAVEAMRQQLTQLQISCDQEASERRSGYNDLVRELRTQLERTDDAETRHRDGLRNLRDALERRMGETSGHFQDLQDQMEGLASDLAGPYSEEVEAVRARCRDLGEEVSARLEGVQVELEKLVSDRDITKSGHRQDLEQRLTELHQRLDAEGQARQRLAETMDVALGEARESLRGLVQEEAIASQRALEALESELGLRLEQDGLSRDDQSSTTKEMLKAKHFVVDREMTDLHRRMDEIEAHTTVVGRLKERDRDRQNISQEPVSPSCGDGAARGHTMGLPGCQGCCVCLVPSELRGEGGEAAGRQDLAHAQEASLEFARHIHRGRSSLQSVPEPTASPLQLADTLASSHGWSEMTRVTTISRGQSAISDLGKPSESDASEAASPAAIGQASLDEGLYAPRGPRTSLGALPSVESAEAAAAAAAADTCEPCSPCSADVDLHAFHPSCSAEHAEGHAELPAPRRQKTLRKTGTLSQAALEALCGPVGDHDGAEAFYGLMDPFSIQMEASPSKQHSSTPQRKSLLIKGTLSDAALHALCGPEGDEEGAEALYDLMDLYSLQQSEASSPSQQSSTPQRKSIRKKGTLSDAALEALCGPVADHEGAAALYDLMDPYSMQNEASSPNQQSSMPQRKSLRKKGTLSEAALEALCGPATDHEGAAALYDLMDPYSMQSEAPPSAAAAFRSGGPLPQEEAVHQDEKEVACLPSPAVSDGCASDVEVQANATLSRHTTRTSDRLLSEVVDESKEVACLPDASHDKKGKDGRVDDIDNGVEHGVFRLRSWQNAGRDDRGADGVQLPGNVAEAGDARRTSNRSLPEGRRLVLQHSLIQAVEDGSLQSFCRTVISDDESGAPVAAGSTEVSRPHGGRSGLRLLAEDLGSAHSAGSSQPEELTRPKRLKDGPRSGYSQQASLFTGPPGSLKDPNGAVANGSATELDMQDFENEDAAPHGTGNQLSSSAAALDMRDFEDDPSAATASVSSAAKRPQAGQPSDTDDDVEAVGVPWQPLTLGQAPGLPPAARGRGRAPERGQPYKPDDAEEEFMQDQPLSADRERYDRDRGLRPSRSPGDSWGTQSFDHNCRSYDESEDDDMAGTLDPRNGGVLPHTSDEDAPHGHYGGRGAPQNSPGQSDYRRGQFGQGSHSGGRSQGSGGRPPSDFAGEPAENLGATFDPLRSVYDTCSPQRGRGPQGRGIGGGGGAVLGDFPAFGHDFPDDSSSSSWTASPYLVNSRPPPPRPKQVPRLQLPPRPPSPGPDSQQTSAAPSQQRSSGRPASIADVSQAAQYWIGSMTMKPEAMVMFGHGGRRSANGVYKPLARTYVDSPVYFCREANTYLFRSKNGTWGIGDRPTGALLAFVPSKVVSPNLISGQWRSVEEVGAPWVVDPKMRLISHKAFQAKLRSSMVVVKSHFADIAGWYLRSTSQLRGSAIYFSSEANKTMWYSGSDWVISDVPDEGPFLANSVETTSNRPEEVIWFDAEVFLPDIPDELQDGETEEVDPDVVEEPDGTDDEQASIVELSQGFVDEDFWPDLSSLGARPPELQVGGESSRVFWVRALQLRLGARPVLVSPAQLETWELLPSPVARGAHGNCHILAAIAALAEFSGFLTRVTFKDSGISPVGCYSLALFDRNGEPLDVTVDDYIPCRPKSVYETCPQPIFSQPDGNQLQVLIVEKALAKRAGSYVALASACAVDGPAPVWQALTGASRQLRWRSWGSDRWVCEVVGEDDTLDTPAVRRQFFRKRLVSPRFRANQPVNVFIRSYRSWVRDGIVLKVLKRALDVEGTCMPAGSVKVSYNAQTGVKWIPPANFDVEVKEADFAPHDEVSVFCRSMDLWTTGEVVEVMDEAGCSDEGEALLAGSVRVVYQSGSSDKWITPDRLVEELRARRAFHEDAVEAEKEEEREELIEAEEDADIDEPPFGMYRHFERCLELNYAIGACASIQGDEGRRTDGLISDFAYPLLGCIDVDGTRLMVLRNIWGPAHSWSGAWAAGAPEWQESPDVWTELQFRFAGLKANSCSTGPSSRSDIFFVAWEDFGSIFEFVYVSPQDVGYPRLVVQRQEGPDLWASSKFLGLPSSPSPSP